MGESRLRATIPRRLILLSSFDRSLEKLQRGNPAVRALVHKCLRRLEAGVSEQRKPLEGTPRNVFRSKLDKGKRLIDEPLDGALSGVIALLYVGHHDDAISWGKAYNKDTEAAVRRALSRAHNRVAREAPAVSYAPEGGAATYGDVLSTQLLERIGIPRKLITSILAAPSVAALDSLGLTPEQELQIEVEFERRLMGKIVPRSVPGNQDDDGARAASLGEITTILRRPLKAFLSTLTPEQRNIVRRRSNELIIVKGAAGSGKTIIGIRRLEQWISQRDMFSRPVLFTCYNKVLAHAATSLIRDTLGEHFDPRLVHVETAYKLLLAIVREHEPDAFPKLVSSARLLLPAVRKARNSVRQPPSLARWRDAWLLQEILDVIFGRAIVRQLDYVKADRRGLGRARALSEKDRPALWRVYERVRKEWAATGVAPWEQVPARLCGILSKKQSRHPRYRGIVVDEVQDLPPSVLRALTLLQGEKPHDNMVLLGDAAQSVYRSGFRWSHAGISAAGHTVILRKCHRSTLNIVRAAVPLVRSQLARFEDDLVIPEGDGDAGPLVRLEMSASEDDEISWVASQVATLLARGVAPSTVAIVCDDAAYRRRIEATLQAADVSVEHFWKPSGQKLVDLDHPSVKLLTIGSAKGMEFPVVFVPGIVESRFPSVDRDSESSDRARRLLYTAMTRAGWQLFLSAERQHASQLLAELDLEGVVA